MAVISVNKMGILDLGRQGENLATTIEIDVTPLLDKYPGAIISLLVKRRGDTDPYFADATVKDGVLNWPITSVETSIVGDGKIEIQAKSGDIIAQSVTATIRVGTSLSGSASTELPDYRPSWVDQVLGAGGNGGSGLLYDIIDEFVVTDTPTGDDDSDDNSDTGSGDESDSGTTTPEGDASAAVAFATDDWATIAAAIKSGSHPYALGDTKSISVGGVEYTLRICDLTSGRYSYADGTAQTNAVIEFVDCYSTGSSGGGKWYINTSERTNVGGYAATTTPEYLAGTLLSALPPALQLVIPTILLPYNIGGGSTEIQYLNCKLFLVSAYEYTGDTTAYHTGAAEGRR